MNGFTPSENCRRRSLHIMLAGALCVLTAGGCSWLQPQNWRTMPSVFTMFGGSGGELNVKSISDADVTLRGGFESGIYTIADQNTATIILYDGPMEKPSQAVTIRMFWNPHAGRTPIDPTATNATIQYVIFGEGGKEIGIYSGAGYLYPNTTVGSGLFTGSVWQSTLRIADKTEGFSDTIGLARLEGKFTVTRDDINITTALHTLNQQVRQRLGRARMVEATVPSKPDGEAKPDDEARRIVGVISSSQP